MSNEEIKSARKFKTSIGKKFYKAIGRQTEYQCGNIEDDFYVIEMIHLKSHKKLAGKLLTNKELKSCLDNFFGRYDNEKSIWKKELYKRQPIMFHFNFANIPDNEKNSTFFQKMKDSFQKLFSGKQDWKNKLSSESKIIDEKTMSGIVKPRIYVRFSNVDREILETGIVDVIQIINDGLSQIENYKPFSNDNGKENSGKYIEGIEFFGTYPITDRTLSVIRNYVYLPLIKKDAKYPAFEIVNIEAKYLAAIVNDAYDKDIPSEHRFRMEELSWNSKIYFNVELDKPLSKYTIKNNEILITERLYFFNEVFKKSNRTIDDIKENGLKIKVILLPTQTKLKGLVIPYDKTSIYKTTYTTIKNEDMLNQDDVDDRFFSKDGSESKNIGVASIEDGNKGEVKGENDVYYNETVEKERRKAIEEKVEKLEQEEKMRDEKENCRLEQLDDTYESEAQYKSRLRNCLTFSDAGNIHIVHKISNTSPERIIPDFNKSNEMLQKSINGMTKKYNIVFDNIPASVLLKEIAPDIMTDDDVDNIKSKTVLKRIFDIRGLKYSRYMINRIKTLKNNLKEDLEKERSNPKTKPYITNILKQFNKVSTNPFFARDVIEVLRKKGYKTLKKRFRKLADKKTQLLNKDGFDKFLKKNSLSNSPHKDEVFKLLDMNSRDGILFDDLYEWVISGKRPKPKSVILTKSNMEYDKPQSIEVQVPKFFTPKSSFTMKIPHDMKFENVKYNVDLFVKLEHLPDSASPGQMLTLKTTGLAKPNFEPFRFIIKKELMETEGKLSVFQIKYGNDDLLVRFADEQSEETYRNMEINETTVLNIIRIDLENFEKNVSRMNAEPSKQNNNDDFDDNKQFNNEELKKMYNFEKNMKRQSFIQKVKVKGEKGALMVSASIIGIGAGNIGTQLAIGSNMFSGVRKPDTKLLSTYADPPFEIMTDPILLNAGPRYDSFEKLKADYPENVLGKEELMKNWMERLENRRLIDKWFLEAQFGVTGPDDPTVTRAFESFDEYTKTDPGRIETLNELTSLETAQATLDAGITSASNWIISSATNISNFLSTGSISSLSTGGIVLLGIVTLTGLAAIYGISKVIIDKFKDLFRTYTSSYKINKFDFINSNINIKKEEQNATTKNLFKILKKYVVAKIEQDTIDPNKPIKYLYPIYVNGKQYIEYVEQETRELSALEESAMEDQENLGMISSDLEEFEGTQRKRFKFFGRDLNLKRNQFHVRFHKNYLAVFRFKGKSYKLDSRTELLLRSKQKKIKSNNNSNTNKTERVDLTLDVIDNIFKDDSVGKKLADGTQKNVYFFKGMIACKQINPNKKPPELALKAILQTLIGMNTRNIIFSYISIDKEAAVVFQTHFTEIAEKGVVLDMLVFNILEATTVANVMKAVAESGLKVKKLVLRRLKDTLGKLRKKDFDKVNKQNKKLEKTEKSLQKKIKKREKTQKKMIEKERKKVGLTGGGIQNIEEIDYEYDEDERLFYDNYNNSIERELEYFDNDYDVEILEDVDNIDTQTGGAGFNSSKIVTEDIGNANFDLITLDLVTFIKNNATTLVEIQLPAQFGVETQRKNYTITKREFKRQSEQAKKISGAIKEINTSKERLSAGLGIVKVIFDKRMFGSIGSSKATQLERRAQKKLYILRASEAILEQLDENNQKVMTIMQNISAQNKAEPVEFKDVYFIEKFTDLKDGEIHDIENAINSFNKETKSRKIRSLGFRSKSLEGKTLLKELRNLNILINKLKETEEYKEAKKNYEIVSKQMALDKSLEMLEAKSKTTEALKRGYTFDSKTHIEILIKSSIFDKMRDEMEIMMVRYNDCWNVPGKKFDNPDNYRTGKKEYKYNYRFPTSVEKKAAYKRALKNRVDEKFFSNSVKINFTNETAKKIENGEEIRMIHPIYLTPITLPNPYTDGIDPGETVRLYLRGKIFTKDRTMSDDTMNFSVRGNTPETNIVQIGIKNNELSKITLEQIKENVKKCEMQDQQLTSLYDIYMLLRNVDASFSLDKDITFFSKYQQFIINSFGVMKRIFYEENVNTSNLVETNFDLNNIFVFVFNSGLVSEGGLRYDKRYGTIFTNFENVKNAEMLDYGELETKKMDTNTVYNLKFGNVSSETYILTISKLEEVVNRKANEKVEKEFAKNDAEYKKKKADKEKRERIREKYVEDAAERQDNIAEAKQDIEERQKEANLEKAQIKKSRKKELRQEAQEQVQAEKRAEMYDEEQLLKEDKKKRSDEMEKKSIEEKKAKDNKIKLPSEEETKEIVNTINTKEKLDLTSDEISTLENAMNRRRSSSGEINLIKLNIKEEKTIRKLLENFNKNEENKEFLGKDVMDEKRINTAMKDIAAYSSNDITGIARASIRLRYYKRYYENVKNNKDTPEYRAIFEKFSL